MIETGCVLTSLKHKSFSFRHFLSGGCDDLPLFPFHTPSPPLTPYPPYIFIYLKVREKEITAKSLNRTAAFL